MMRLGDAIDEDPLDAKRWSARADARAESGDDVGAISDYLRAVKLTPTEPLVWQKLVDIYRRCGLSTKAASTEQKLLELMETPRGEA